MRLNGYLILRLLGLLLMVNGVAMGLCLPFSIYYGEGDTRALLISGSLVFVAGMSAWIGTRQRYKRELRRRDGFLIVTLGWIILSVSGMLPYLFSGAIPSITNAFFETLSGYSTTGSTILTDIEALPKGILFWRSLTQWIGGMGIIVLAVAILPVLGIGGMQLFVAEAPGVSHDKLQPRINETAKRLWLLYLSLTCIECLLLLVGGMSFYDALNHSLTTMATGGFSTKNASIAAFPSPFIQYTITCFMLLAGVNFSTFYFLLRKPQKAIRNEEFITYILFCIIVALSISFGLYFVKHYDAEKSFRVALFHVISVVTTTGYVTEDYTAWSHVMQLTFFLLMFIGGSAGSTAGGIKIVRHIVLIKNSFLEIKRQLHPSAILLVRLNKKAISQSITFNILAFIIIYVLIFGFGSILLASLEIDFQTSIGAVATCLGNIGPGIGSVGPVHNFAHMPVFAKWILSLFMLMGRLELFTVLILFTSFFWRKYR